MLYVAGCSGEVRTPCSQSTKLNLLCFTVQIRVNKAWIASPYLTLCATLRKNSSLATCFYWNSPQFLFKREWWITSQALRHKETPYYCLWAFFFLSSRAIEIGLCLGLVTVGSLAYAQQVVEVWAMLHFNQMTLSSPMKLSVASIQD